METEKDQYYLVCKERFDRMESQFNKINSKLDSIDNNLRGDGKLLGVNARISGIESKLANVSKLVWTTIAAIIVWAVTAIMEAFS